jgi:hypothetical protein
LALVTLGDPKHYVLCIGGFDVLGSRASFLGTISPVLRII